MSSEAESVFRLGNDDAAKGEKEHALSLWEEAAQMGCVAAMVRSGVAWLIGYAGEHKRSYERGLEWLRSAAALGSADAKARLGVLLLDGYGDVGKDVPRGLELIRQAANDGDPKACGRLGWEYINGGLGDPDAGVELLKKGAAAEDKDALYRLGLLCRDGKHVAKNIQEAMNYFRLAYANGNRAAAFAIGVSTFKVT